MLRENFDDKITKQFKQHKKLKQEKQVLGGKVSSQTSYFKQLEQENKSLKNILSKMIEDLNNRGITSQLEQVRKTDKSKAIILVSKFLNFCN